MSTEAWVLVGFMMQAAVASFMFYAYATTRSPAYVAGCAFTLLMAMHTLARVAS